MIVASLSAVAIPNVNGQLTIPISDDTLSLSGTLRLVNSREHFLTRVRAGHAVTMLVEIPQTCALRKPWAL